jgi:hypothetical protein
MNLGVHDHPFYKPLWRRVMIVLVTALWAGLEAFVLRDGMWTVVAGAFFAFSVWAFLISYPKEK